MSWENSIICYYNNMQTKNTVLAKEKGIEI